MRYKAAIFDFDGTLLDTLEDLADAMNAILREYGMPVHPVDSYRYFVGDGMENLARRSAIEGTGDAVIRAMAERIDVVYGDGWNRKTRPYDGVADLLAEMRAKGLKIGLLSNKPDQFTQVMAKYYFSPGAFDAVFGSRPGVPKKPDPAAALEIAGLFHLQPPEILYFGDTNTDMRTGRSAGMATIGVSWGFRPVAELKEAGAQAIIDTPAEALRFLDE